jgi:hypothetical protein
MNKNTLVLIKAGAKIRLSLDFPLQPFVKGPVFNGEVNVSQKTISRMLSLSYRSRGAAKFYPLRAVFPSAPGDEFMCTIAANKG